MSFGGWATSGSGLEQLKEWEGGGKGGRGNAGIEAKRFVSAGHVVLESGFRSDGGVIVRYLKKRRE